MRRWGAYIDGIVCFWCSLVCYVCRAPPGQGYGQRDNEHGRYDAPLGYVHGWDRVLLVHLTDVDLCRAPPGQGYGQRDNERGRYDAPSGYVHRWNSVFLVLTGVFICAELRLARGTDNVITSMGATIRRRGTYIVLPCIFYAH